MDETFIRNIMIWGEESQKKLTASHVIVFGLGGVGSYVVEALARSGIGELTLVDQDTFSKSNINRQLGALNSTIALPKAQVLADRVLDINPACIVHPIVNTYNAETRSLFFNDRVKYDYVVDAIDLVSCKIDLALTTQSLEIPLIMSLGTGNKLDPSQFHICDISETHTCPLARVMRKELRSRGVLHQTVLYSTEDPITPLPLEDPPPGRHSIPASNPWTPSVAGLMIAGYVVQKIL